MVVEGAVTHGNVGVSDDDDRDCDTVVEGSKGYAAAVTDGVVEVVITGESSSPTSAEWCQRVVSSYST